MKVPANIVKAAKNLPKTMPIRLIGAVSRSCSVRILRSSLNIFIVKSGIRTMKINMMIVK